MRPCLADEICGSLKHSPEEWTLVTGNCLHHRPTGLQLGCADSLAALRVDEPFRLYFSIWERIQLRSAIKKWYKQLRMSTLQKMAEE